MHTENSFVKLQSTCDIWIWRLNCLVYAWNRMNPCRTSCISLHPLHHEGLWTLEQVYELAQLPVVDENVKYLRRFQVNWAVTKYITVCVSSKQKKKTFTSLKVSVVNNKKKKRKVCFHSGSVCVCLRLWWQEKWTVMKTNGREKNFSLCILQQVWNVCQNMTRRSCRKEVGIGTGLPWLLLQVTAHT